MALEWDMIDQVLWHRSFLAIWIMCIALEPPFIKTIANKFRKTLTGCLSAPTSVAHVAWYFNCNASHQEILRKQMSSSVLNYCCCVLQFCKWVFWWKGDILFFHQFSLHSKMNNIISPSCWSSCKLSQDITVWSWSKDQVSKFKEKKSWS